MLVAAPQGGTGEGGHVPPFLSIFSNLSKFDETKLEWGRFLVRFNLQFHTIPLYNMQLLFKISGYEIKGCYKDASLQ